MDRAYVFLIFVNDNNKNQKEIDENLLENE